VKLFVTVGSMLPFDRLVRAVDAIVAARADIEGFAQVGETRYRPAHMTSTRMMTPAEYRSMFEQADVVVSHVGIGTVITASELGKPLVMLPRQMELQEVTSRHQQATARWLAGRPGVHIVSSEADLAAKIDEVVGSGGVGDIESGTRAALVRAVRDFIGA
jgi:UDP-N-acetylglucosamine transferase subunit ALG13